jgi:hypothetical protein
MTEPEAAVTTDIPEVVAGPAQAPETPPLMQKLVKHCCDLRDVFMASEYRSAKLEEIEKSRKAYEQQQEDDGWPFEGARNIVVPMTTITVDNMEPRLVAGLIGKDPVVRFEMDGMNEKDEPTNILEDWYNKELKNTVKIKPATVNLIHNVLLDGTVFCIPAYDLKEIKRRRTAIDQMGKPVMDQATGLPAKVEVMETVSEGGRIDLIPFDDILIPDDVGTIEEWEECDKIRIVRPTYGELQRLQQKGAPGYANVGPYLLTGNATDAHEGSTAQQVDGIKITGKEIVECIECHISYPIYQEEEKGPEEQVNFEEERIIVTIATKTNTVIRLIKQNEILGENSSLIKRIRLFPEWGKSYGTSIFGKLKNIQQGGTDIFNMIINVAYLTMMPWFFYDNKSGLRGEKTLKPGKGVSVDDVNGVMIPEFKVNPGQYIQFLNVFTTLWERVGSIGDWQLGRTNERGGRKTATEVMSVIQEGNIKHNYQAEVTKDEFTAVLQTLYDFYFEKMNPAKVFTYAGKAVKIPVQAMKRGYRFVLAASTEAANKYIDRREKEDLMNLLGGDPYINPLKPREEILKAYGIFNVGEWINPQVKMIADAAVQNPEVGRVVQQYLQEKAAVQGMIGGDEGADQGPAQSGGLPGSQAA